MSTAILISVRVHDGRYYGVPDWPPAPARLFQALVAGVGLSGPLGKTESEALGWLEKKCVIAPPVIGAPAARRGQQVMFYMPNNDLDRVGGDPQRLAEVRTAKKFFRPYIFDAAVPFLYVWSLDETEERGPHARVVCALAERLYQLGRGVDMAWAWAELLDASSLEEVLSNYRGRIYRPSNRGSERTLACPIAGSLYSLAVRYRAYSRRFESAAEGRNTKRVFTRAPIPRFQSVAYESPPSMRIYELREPSGPAPFVPWPLVRVAELAEHVRDGALDRLRPVLPSRAEEIARVLVGRKPDGSNDCPTDARVRIVPLPSIGHVHADRAIRRVLVQVPANCSLDAGDVHWAFSGLDLVDHDTREMLAVLTPARDNAILGHYGIGDGVASRSWRSVTPVALPQVACRRRIEPSRKIGDAKDGHERFAVQVRAAISVGQALRHAGVQQRPEAIRLQREPFEANGARVEAFADGTRFAKERLWHVEIAFGAPILGPLIIGDGRFLGLGVMAPVARTEGIHTFAVDSGLIEKPDPTEIAHAARRAVMARVQEVLGFGVALPAFFSGHERDGAPAGTSHLAFAFDPRTPRLLIVAPHILDRREPTGEEKRHVTTLEKALEGFEELRAGSAGHLALRQTSVGTDSDSLMAPSRVWESVTPYLVTRHAKSGGAAETLVMDLRADCRRRGLPEPLEVKTLESRGLPNVGLLGRARLTFAVAVKGPILLGKSRYCGGGLFAPSSGA